MARTRGKKVKSIEFDNELLDALQAIAGFEQSTLSRIVRIACDRYAEAYTKKSPLKYGKKPVTYKSKSAAFSRDFQ